MIVSKAIAQTSRHSGVIPWKQTPVQIFVRDGLPAYIRLPKGFCFLAVASATKRAQPGGRPHPVCPPRALHARALSHRPPSCCMPAPSARPFRSAASHLFFVATNDARRAVTLRGAMLESRMDWPALGCRIVGRSGGLGGRFAV